MTPDPQSADPLHVAEDARDVNPFWRGFRKGVIQANVIGLPVLVIVLLIWVANR